MDVTTSLMLAGEQSIGILRVEREIANRLLASTELCPVPVVFREDGALFALHPEQVARIFLARQSVEFPEIRSSTRCSAIDRNGLIACPTSPPPRISAGRLKLRAAAALRGVVRAGMSRTPKSMREDVREIVIRAGKIARTVFRGYGSVTAAPPNFAALRDQILATLRMKVNPRLGDVLWTAGLYSNFVPLRMIGEMRVRTGLRVVTTCYDLIRVTHPEFNPRSMGPELFTADAVALLDCSDLVLAISASTRSELVAFAARVGRPIPAVQVVRLGSDLPAVNSRPVSEALVIPQELKKRRFALAVGTVEARKNYGLLVRVWERLAADPAFQLDLVIVGRRGFESDDSCDEIECSPLFGNRIRWLDRCSDETLSWLYETCHFVLYPSLVEGWGLPVTEALGFGRHVIASNRGAIPEAAFGLAQLLDPEEEESWLTAIAEVGAAPRLETKLRNPPTWDAASAAVRESLRRLLMAGSAH